jgi:hypothetical protein
MYNPRCLSETTRDSIAVIDGKMKAVPIGISVSATSIIAYE